MIRALNLADLPNTGTSYTFEGYKHDGVNVSMFVIDFPPGKGPELHRHPYEELFVIHEGRARMSDGETSLEAAAGQIMIVPPDVPHGFASVGDGRLRMVCLTLMSG